MNLNKLIHELLNEIGVPTHIKGYAYIKTGLKLALQRPYILQAMTKEFYPIIAAEHSTTDSRVERAIRHAIENTFSNSPTDVLEKFFGNATSRDSGKPTNGMFFASVVEYIKVYCLEEENV